MAANSSIVLTNLDFDTHKNTLKQYLKSQDRFKDYDFDGSNMSVLLDILSYNTVHNAFYLNMIGSEMFLDTAVLRDSVVSHAKELNYTPGSFKSAEANVNIVVTSTNQQKRSIVVPKGTTFNSRFVNKNYTFSVAENIIIKDYTTGSGTIVFTGENITLYEGYYTTDQFTVNSGENKRYVLSNKNVDVSSISVTILEDVGSTLHTYNRATSLFGLNSTSKVFFIQGAEGDGYELVFGDGVIGRPPKEGSVVSIEYRISNGELPNGCSSFTADGSIDGEQNIRVLVNSKASGGSIGESLESIKFNAPRHFTTQDRAVSAEDYENILKLNFPEINVVSAYGGEDLDPPQFGKVFVAVDLKDVDALPEVKKDQYYKFLKPRSPVSIDPVFVEPQYLYIGVESSVSYDINKTRLSTVDISTLVTSAIVDYAADNLNNFNRVLRYSKLVNAIDGAQLAVVSNETKIKGIKLIRPLLNTTSSFDLKYGFELDTKFASSGGYTVISSQFTAGGKASNLQDDGEGRLFIIAAASGQVVAEVGTVDYSTGTIRIVNFVVSAFEGNDVKVYVVPKSLDVASSQNAIINIIEEDVKLSVTAVRE